MRMGSRHWMTAVVLAIAIHVGVAAAMLWQRADAGAKAPGIGGIEIALGVAGGAPGSVAAEAPAAETAEEQPTEEAKPEIEPIADITEAEPPTDAVEEAPTAEATQFVDQATSVEETQTTETMSVVVPPRPKPKPSPPKLQCAKAKPTPAPEPAVENKPDTAASDQPTAVQLAATEPSAPGSGGKAGAQETAEAGSNAADAAAGGRPGAKADYGAILLAWLERHKEYPRAAQRHRQQGVVLLYIVMERDGSVIESRIQESSGHRLLDEAALAMLERAQPLPPIPDDIRKERLRFVVPVQFFMT